MELSEKARQLLVEGMLAGTVTHHTLGMTVYWRVSADDAPTAVCYSDAELEIALTQGFRAYIRSLTTDRPKLDVIIEAQAELPDHMKAVLLKGVREGFVRRDAASGAFESYWRRRINDWPTTESGYCKAEQLEWIWEHLAYMRQDCEPNWTTPRK